MVATDTLRALVAGALDLVFAPVCVGCGSAIPTVGTQRLICGVCWSRARPIPSPRCNRCWGPLPSGGIVERSCAVCAVLPPRLRVVRSAFTMAGPVREFVHALKYRGWHSAAEPLAERLATLPLPPDVEEEARTIIPVLTSAERLRTRGYNQAAVLAEAFARQTGRAFEPEILVRTRRANTQTGLHPDERRANVAGAFGVPAAGRAPLEGRHVLLVDDVWTTGATAGECTAALLRGGARLVSVLTLARALANRDP